MDPNSGRARGSGRLGVGLQLGCSLGLGSVGRARGSVGRVGSARSGRLPWVGCLVMGARWVGWLGLVGGIVKGSRSEY